jgi:hypothetical protein
MAIQIDGANCLGLAIDRRFAAYSAAHQFVIQLGWRTQNEAAIPAIV